MQLPRSTEAPGISGLPVKVLQLTKELYELEVIGDIYCSLFSTISPPCMFNTSLRTLKLLAALVWFSGVVVLFIKSSSLFLEAEGINPEQPWTWLAVLAGLVLGGIKARYLFSRLCFKNLKRIDALEQPKLWHFYRARFFIFLFLMVSSGAFLSRQAHGDYSMLIAVAVVELSVGTALLGSSNCFWREQKKYK